MHMARMLTLLCLVVAGVAHPASGQFRLAAVDILTTIDPLTGEAVKGVGGRAGEAWQKQNPVWDGSTIRVTALRGETACVQVVLLRDAEVRLRGIGMDVELSGLDVGTWRAWCIWGTPEIALPLKGLKEPFCLPGTFEWEQDFTAKAIAWPMGVEITVPRDARPGTYRGRVTVTAGEASKQSLPVELRVLEAELPPRPTYRAEMNSYGDFFQYLPRTPASTLAVYRLMRDHRCVFTFVPYNQGGTLVAGFLAPKVQWGPEGKPTLDWTDFDKTFGTLMDGSAFADQRPLELWLMPLCYNWPVPFGQYNKGRDAYLRRNVAFRKALLKHFRSKGWTRTIFEEFHNENPEAGAKLPWHLDEPRDKKDFRGHDLFLEIFEQAFGGAANIDVRYRLDISWWQRLGEGFLAYGPRVQDWSVSRDPRFLTPEAAEMFRTFAKKSGGSVIEYGEMSGFMAGGKIVNLSQFGQYLLRCRRLGLDGFAQWMIDMWKTKDAPGPHVPLTYSNASGSRDLIWPGTALGYDGPLPSLRLKALREAMNLMDYARLVETTRPGKAKAVDALFENFDTATSADHYRAKDRLAEWLAQPQAE